MRSLLVPDRALRWGRLTAWWGEWRTGLRNPPAGHRVPKAVVWDDLQPGDRCSWRGCRELATHVSASFPVQFPDGDYVVSGGRWCEAHRPSRQP